MFNFVKPHQDKIKSNYINLIGIFLFAFRYMQYTFYSRKTKTGIMAQAVCRLKIQLLLMKKPIF